MTLNEINLTRKARRGKIRRATVDGDLIGVRLKYRLGSKLKYRKLEKALAACKKFDDWGNQRNEPNDEGAKTALRNFFEVLLTISPDKHFELNRSVQPLVLRPSFRFPRRFEIFLPYHGNTFRAHLRQLRKALEEHNYPRACNELITLYVHEPILQCRIYVCLEELYREYLEK